MIRSRDGYGQLIVPYRSIAKAHVASVLLEGVLARIANYRQRNVRRTIPWTVRFGGVQVGGRLASISAI